MRQWKLLSRHKHWIGIVIYEYCHVNNDLVRKYTGNINGFSLWDLGSNWEEAIKKAQEIRERIQNGDETVFQSELETPEEVGK